MPGGSDTEGNALVSGGSTLVPILETGGSGLVSGLTILENGGS